MLKCPFKVFLFKFGPYSRVGLLYFLKKGQNHWPNGHFALPDVDDLGGDGEDGAVPKDELARGADALLLPGFT